MAFLEAFIQNLTSVIVSYTYAILAILLIVKIIQALFGIGGGNGGGWNPFRRNDDNNRNRDDGNRGRGGGGGDGGRTPGGDNPDEPNPWNADGRNMGRLRIQVVDIEGTGVPGAIVEVRCISFARGTPLSIRRQYGRRFIWVGGGFRGNPTERNGFWPGPRENDYQTLPAGHYNIRAQSNVPRRLISEQILERLRRDQYNIRWHHRAPTHPEHDVATITSPPRPTQVPAIPPGEQVDMSITIPYQSPTDDARPQIRGLDWLGPRHLRMRGIIR
jgi:hypothetical protein